MGNVVICGDSFSAGIGCRDLQNEPYGSLLSKKLGKNLINLARGSSSNFAIMLQVKYAIENYKDIDLLCIGVTSYDRTEWFKEDSEYQHFDVNLTDVNYHQYPPYGETTYISLLENPLKNDPKYKGDMLVENYLGIIEYVNYITERNGEKIGYYEKFIDEPIEKMKLLKQYYLEIFDIGIKRMYDFGLITMCHSMLKKHNINHLILTHEPNELSPFIDINNMVHVDWGLLSTQHPDDLPSQHTSKEGHKIVYNQILKKINE
jgi:hypothetical protein